MMDDGVGRFGGMVMGAPENTWIYLDTKFGYISIILLP